MTIESFKQDLDAAYEGGIGAFETKGSTYAAEYPGGVIKYYFWINHKEAIKDEHGNWIEKK